MNCINCGNFMNDGDRFCMKCGTPAQAVASAPAPGPQPQVQAQPVQPVVINPQAGQDPNAKPPVIPYAPPIVEGGLIRIPVGRKFRVRCPDCGTVSDDIKRDETFGFPCPVCKKAYAYGGQLLIYRMGSFHPLKATLQMHIVVDEVDYGFITNQESVRVMLPSGNHVVRCGFMHTKQNPYNILVAPEYNTFAFKFNLPYHGPYRLPGSATAMEFTQCNPEDIPNI